MVAPSIPMASARAPSASQVRKEFTVLKRSLNELPAWDLTHPATGELIELKVTETGNENQAKTYAASF